jgi:hypothetical protein
VSILLNEHEALFWGEEKIHTHVARSVWLSVDKLAFAGDIGTRLQTLKSITREAITQKYGPRFYGFIIFFVSRNQELCKRLVEDLTSDIPSEYVPVFFLRCVVSRLLCEGTDACTDQTSVSV